MAKLGVEDGVKVAEIIGAIQDMDYTNSKLLDEIEYLRKNHVNLDKMYTKTMTVEMVAYLHDVHQNTVRKYVNCGLIEKHPTSSHGKILIRASEALTLDFSELRKKSKVLIYK